MSDRALELELRHGLSGGDVVTGYMDELTVEFSTGHKDYTPSRGKNAGITRLAYRVAPEQIRDAKRLRFVKYPRYCAWCNRLVERGTSAGGRTNQRLHTRSAPLKWNTSPMSGILVEGLSSPCYAQLPRVSVARPQNSARRCARR